jgi:divalent metal cation (Fe/Co/Zn/Cd) transporter
VSALAGGGADGVAAGAISLSIVKDGAQQLKHSFGDLMDRRPERIERDRPDPLAREVRRFLERLD